MLQPRELCKSVGFPDSYEFRGTKKDQVKQIGNAIPPYTAMALVLACLD